MKAFRNTMIVLVVLGIICGALSFVISAKKEVNRVKPTERTNTTFTETKRVFDEADILSEEEEEELQAYIEEKEKLVSQDIVLLLIDDLSVQDPNLLKEYAENWYREKGIGWNKPTGDGVLYVDNWAEGASAKYTRMVTCGTSKESLSQNRVDKIIDDTCENVNSDPLGSYKTFVDETATYIIEGDGLNLHIPFFVAPLIAILGAGGFLLLEISSNKGVDTTNSETYTKDGSFHMRRKQDIFLHSHITTREISDDHDSGGGGDFGGGGGSH